MSNIESPTIQGEVIVDVYAVGSPAPESNNGFSEGNLGRSSVIPVATRVTVSPGVITAQGVIDTNTSQLVTNPAVGVAVARGDDLVARIGVTDPPGVIDVDDESESSDSYDEGKFDIVRNAERWRSSYTLAQARRELGYVNHMPSVPVVYKRAANVILEDLIRKLEAAGLGRIATSQPVRNRVVGATVSTSGVTGTASVVTHATS